MHPFTDAVLLSLLYQKQVKASMSITLLGCHLHSSALIGAAGSVYSLQPWVARYSHQPSLNQYTELNHYTQQSERDAVAWSYDSEVSSGLV